jgi:SRSO17 transposase
VLAEQADRLGGGLQAALVIDGTALPRKGTLSIGVARQYYGPLGKRANCQAMVSLTLAGQEVPVPVGLRLSLPEEWTADPERCLAAGLPEDEMMARSKGEIALAEVDRLIAAEVRFGLTLADAGYGVSAAFRQGLSERGLTWGVGIPRNQKVYGADVQLVPPTDRKRRWVPDQEPREAEAVLAGGRMAIERGTRILSLEPAAAGLAACPGRRHQGALGLRAGAPELKQELGLGHFEGRSWTGLHRHALMGRRALAYLQSLRLAGQRPTGPGENVGPYSGTATIPEPASRALRHHGASVRRFHPADPMSALSART